MRYPVNPEFDAQLKEEWDKIGLSREIQETLLQFMGAAALNMLNKESRRIARCLSELADKWQTFTGSTCRIKYFAISQTLFAANKSLFNSALK